MSKQSELADLANTVSVNSSAPADSITIDANGKVGIGSSSPQAELDVSAATPQFRILESGSGEGNRLLVDVDTDGVSYTATFGSGGTPQHRWFTTSNERMRIDTSGNLLVAQFTTVSPGVSNTTVGHVLNSVGYATHSRDDGPALHLNRTTSDGDIVTLRRNGNTVGSISVTASATAYNTSSDYRLKEDWQPMLSSWDRVKDLKPVNFAWKVDGSRVDGFLAHELAEVVPEAVTGEKDAVDDEGNPEYQGIDQSKLVPLLTAALQEALARIETLEADVAVLKGGA